ncbi:hypothetical protein IFM89_020958 [Coptis chinensis]|uniref:Uncharacterized protein n=1 Tax=Coptis chinensis TaxID=261450 RepID=A0A835M8S2_9MAGN|nr:hypothetical protein IFM89_020958 [Coptis chinensis]
MEGALGYNRTPYHKATYHNRTMVQFQSDNKLEEERLINQCLHIRGTSHRREEDIICLQRIGISEAIVGTLVLLLDTTGKELPLAIVRVIQGQAKDKDSRRWSRGMACKEESNEISILLWDK